MSFLQHLGLLFITVADISGYKGKFLSAVFRWMHCWQHWTKTWCKYTLVKLANWSWKSEHQTPNNKAAIYEIMMSNQKGTDPEVAVTLSKVPGGFGAVKLKSIRVLPLQSSWVLPLPEQNWERSWSKFLKSQWIIQAERCELLDRILLTQMRCYMNACARVPNGRGFWWIRGWNENPRNIYYTAPTWIQGLVGRSVSQCFLLSAGWHQPHYYLHIYR